MVVMALMGSMLGACLPSADANGDTAERTMPFDGAMRSFSLYLPRSTPAKPALVLVLHGRGGSGAGIQQRTRRAFDSLADRDGSIIAYPDSIRGDWHSGHPWIRTEGDDVGFLAALVDLLAIEYSVDRNRIYVTGHSNGAGMAYRFACERADVIAALAPVGGGLANSRMRRCAEASKRPIPLMVVHGIEDPINRFDDGELEGNVQYWIRRNGCELKPVVAHQAGDVEKRTRIESYTHCSGGADVVLYAIENCGHNWPGGTEPFRWREQGPSCSHFDAVPVIWEFFRRHPKR